PAQLPDRAAPGHPRRPHVLRLRLDPVPGLRGPHGVPDPPRGALSGRDRDLRAVASIAPVHDPRDRDLLDRGDAGRGPRQPDGPGTHAVRPFRDHDVRHSPERPLMTEPLDSPHVVLLSGLSGGGKTAAAKLFEDLAYTVVDN